MLSRILFCGLTLAFMIACGDDEISTDDAGTETAGTETAGNEVSGTETAGSETAGTGMSSGDVESFTNQGMMFFAKITCQAFVTCAAEGRLSSPGLEFILGRHSSVDVCATDLSSYLPVPTDASSVEAGLINFDADAATECLNEINAIDIASSSCDELLAVVENTPESCERVIQGTVEVGGACSNNNQCADETYCEVSGEMMCEIGVCTVDDDTMEEEPIEGTAMLGEACEDSEDCAGDLFCSTTETACVELSWHMEGEACEFGGAKMCNPGLVCQLDLMTFSSTCVQPLAMGEACLFGPQCEVGLTCIGANLEVGMTGTCSALGESGAPCMVNPDCVDSLSCNYDREGQGTCGASPEECPLPM